MSTMWFLHLLSWLLVSDSFTSVVSYHRHTGFVLTLPMLTRLKFLNLVLPTVTSWLVIWVHLFVFLERKRWLGQCINNNKRLLKGSSFSVGESWLWLTCRACPTLSMHCVGQASQTPFLLDPHEWPNPTSRSWVSLCCSWQKSSVSLKGNF